MMLRISLLSGATALALLVISPLSAASAGQRNSAPTYQNAAGNAFGLGGSAGALSANANAIDQSNLRIEESHFTKELLRELAQLHPGDPRAELWEKVGS